MSTSTWSWPPFIAVNHWLSRIDVARACALLVLLAGIGSTLVGILAYAPAKGADALDYMLHAAFLDGADLPSSLANFQPIYPLLIYTFTHLPGGLYALIIVQLVLSSVQGLLFFWALRPFSLLVAFLVGLIVALDMQSRVMFNFLSTESVYMFLLALSFFLLMRQIQPPLRFKLAGDVALVAALVALSFTRSVGQPIIVVVLIVYLLKTRSWRRTAAIGVAFVAASWLFLTVYNLAFPRIHLAAGNSNQNMIVQPLFRSGLLQEENGPASQRLLQLRAMCPDLSGIAPLNRCMSDYAGRDRLAYLGLLREAYIELIRTHPLAYAQGMLNQFTEFLSLTGDQLPADAPTPASVQCQNLEAIVDETFNHYLQNDILLSTAQSVNTDALRAAIHENIYRLCPPLPENAQMRSLVDYIAFRYRSLSRPRPWLWYSVLALGVLLFPLARRLWPVALSAFLILSAHAALSAAVFNVQPRYTVVTNPFKAILLVLLLYIAAQRVAQIADRWMARRLITSA